MPLPCYFSFIMSRPAGPAKSTMTMKRLMNELEKSQKEPMENIDLYPDESNMLVWYFCILDTDKTSPYHGGKYVGKITHQPNYPLSAPSIMVMTPSGRFNPGQKICMDNTSFHNESWSNSWNMNTILLGLLSIMIDDRERGHNMIVYSDKAQGDAIKKKMAASSHEWNERYVKEIYSKFRDGFR